jgi:hypothetical protein
MGSSRVRTGTAITTSRLTRTLLVGAVLGAMGTAPVAVAAPPATAAVADAESRLLVEQLVADKAITVARERRLAEADEEELLAALATKDQALRAAEAEAVGREAELSRVRKARDRIASERRVLVDALAERDLALAAEIGAYREAVSEIAASPDPRKRAALQRFADGEQRPTTGAVRGSGEGRSFGTCEGDARRGPVGACRGARAAGGNRDGDG